MQYGIGFDPGGLVSGALNYFSAQDANARMSEEANNQRMFQERMYDRALNDNTRLNREQNAFNAQEAVNARQWQEKMSSTAYQRSMADMKKAGLNPILTAAGGGGASTPSGATASGSAPRQTAPAGAKADVINTRMGDIISGAISTAFQRKQVDKEMESKDSAIKVNEAMAETEKTKQTVNAATARQIEAQRIKTLKEAQKLEAGMPAAGEEGITEAKRARVERSSWIMIPKSIFSIIGSALGIGNSAKALAQ